MTGIYHNPDGRVLPTQPNPIIGNNIVFNIVNTFSYPNAPQNESEAGVISRPIKNQAPVRICSDTEANLKVIYNKTTNSNASIPRPHTQMSKHARKSKKSSKPKLSSASPPTDKRENTSESKKIISRPKLVKSKPPNKNDIIVTLKKQNNINSNKNTAVKKKSKSKQKKQENSEKKPANIPHSVNRFKGKYDEIAATEFKPKKEFLAEKVNKRAETNEEIKKRQELVKMEALKIRRENYYLLKSGETEKPYIDPEKKRKQDEKIKEKQDAEKHRKEWRQKLENRHKEMGLEFIHKEDSENNNKDLILKQEKRPQTAGSKRPKSKTIQKNDKISELIKGKKEKSEQPSARKDKPGLTQEEKERRKKLVEEQYKNALLTQAMKQQEKEILETEKYEKLQELEMNRRLMLEQELEEKRQKRQKMPKKPKNDLHPQENDDNDELTVLKLNKWIKQEKGEKIENLDEIPQKLERPQSAQVKKIQQKIRPISEEHEEIMFSNEKPRQKLLDQQKTQISKKAEEVRLKQLEQLKTQKIVSPRLTDDDKKLMQTKMQEIQERMRKIMQRKKEEAKKNQEITKPKESQICESEVSEITQNHASNQDENQANKLKIETPIQTDENPIKPTKQVTEFGINTENINQQKPNEEPKTPEKTIPQIIHEKMLAESEKQRKSIEIKKINEPENNEPKRIFSPRQERVVQNPRNLPGVVNLSEHVKKYKTVDKMSRAKAATEIQRFIRGYLARKLANNLKNNFKSIDEQFTYNKRISSPRDEKFNTAPCGFYNSPFIREKDPLSVVNIFIKKNLDALKQTLTQQEIQEIKEENEQKVPFEQALITPEKKEEIQKTEEKQKNINQSASSSIHEEIMESLKGSLKKSLAKNLSEHASSIKEEIEPLKSMVNTAQKSIPEEIEPIKNIEELQKTHEMNKIVEQQKEETERTYQDKLTKEGNEMLQKFIEITKDMQTQHKAEITEIIDRLCEHLKAIGQPTIVQVAPTQIPVTNVPITSPPQKVSAKKAEESYEPDFEEESNRFSIKGKSNAKLSSSIKEEIEPIDNKKLDKTPVEIPEELEVEQESDHKEISSKKPSVTVPHDSIAEEIEGSIAKASNTSSGKPSVKPVHTKVVTDEEIEEIEITDEQKEKDVSKESFEGVKNLSESIYSKFKEVVKNSKLDEIIKNRERTINKRYNDRLAGLREEYQNGDMSFKEHQAKRREIDDWYENEQKSIKQDKHKQIATLLKQVISTVEQLDHDKEKIKLVAEKNQEMTRQEAAASIKIESLSEIPEVTKEIENIRKELPLNSPEQRRKELLQKRLAAEKLLAEKKKAIEEGVKDKILKLEEEEVDNLYKQAIQVDVKAEIENRAKAALEVMKAKKAKEKSPPKPVQNVKNEPNPSDSIAEEIQGSIDKQSFANFKGGNVKPSDSIQEDINLQSRQSANKNDKSIQESIKESLAKSIDATKSKLGEKSIEKESIAKSSIKESIPAKVPPNANTSHDDYAYSMKFDEESQAKLPEKPKAETKKQGPDDYSYSMKFDEDSHADLTNQQKPVKKHSNADEALSDSNSKLFASSEDFEALANSDVEWIFNLDQAPVTVVGMNKESVTPDNKATPSTDKRLPSVAEQREDDEENRTESRKDEPIESEIGEESVKNTVEGYDEDFEDESQAQGGKTPKDIKGRTAEPDSPYSSVDMSLDASKKDNNASQGSSQFKISLERIVKDSAENKGEQIKQPEIPIEEQRVLCNAKIEEFIENLISQNVTELIQEKSKDIDETLEKLKEKERLQAEFEKQQAENLRIQKQLEEEEKQRKELAEAYEKKRLTDLNRKTDNMTDDILSQLLESIKEELFPQRSSEKFDITPPLIPPEYPISNVQPAVSEIVQIPQKKHITGVKTNLSHVEKYIDEVFGMILKNSEKFVQSLSQPLNRDPLVHLGQLQNEDPDYFNSVEATVTQPVLPVELYLELEKIRKVDAVAEKPDDHQHEALLTEWSNIHNKSIFDAINDALDYYRPYGIRGPPLLWSKKTRELTFRNGSVTSIKEILAAVKQKVLAWANTNAGMMNAPASIIEKDVVPDKSKIDQFREERLEAVLSVEVNDGEAGWVDYENEETQTILDTADMILEKLVTEAVQSAHDIEKDREDVKGNPMEME